MSRAAVGRNGSDTSSWHEIGAAWPHDDGKGFSIKLDALPFRSEIVLGERAEREKPELYG